MPWSLYCFRRGSKFTKLACATIDHRIWVVCLSIWIYQAFLIDAGHHEPISIMVISVTLGESRDYHSDSEVTLHGGHGLGRPVSNHTRNNTDTNVCHLTKLSCLSDRQLQFWHHAVQPVNILSVWRQFRFSEQSLNSVHGGWRCKPSCWT